MLIDISWRFIWRYSTIFTYLLTYSLSEVPPMDKQCRSAIIISTTVICRLKYPKQTAATASIPCHNGRVWHLEVANTSQTSTYVTDRHAGPAWVVIHSGWLQREQGDACGVGKVHIKQSHVLCSRCDLWHRIEVMLLVCGGKCGGGIKWLSMR